MSHLLLPTVAGQAPVVELGTIDGEPDANWVSSLSVQPDPFARRRGAPRFTGDDARWVCRWSVRNTPTSRCYARWRCSRSPGHRPNPTYGSLP